MNKYKKNNIVMCQVSGIKKYGVFVKVDENHSGLIHISEITNNFVRNIFDYVNVGDCIYCKILEIDDENNQLKLSIKDIDYRYNGKKLKVDESKKGFEPLGKKLPLWTKEKLKEINQENLK